MPIDSTEDIETVETKIESGPKKGDQVEGKREEVDPDATDDEIAGSNLIKSDDPSNNNLEDGDEGFEETPFGDALQGGDQTDMVNIEYLKTRVHEIKCARVELWRENQKLKSKIEELQKELAKDKGENPDENPPDDSSDGGDTSGGGFKPDTSGATFGASLSMTRVENSGRPDEKKQEPAEEINPQWDPLEQAEWDKRRSDKQELIYEKEQNEKQMDNTETQIKHYIAAQQNLAKEMIENNALKSTINALKSTIDQLQKQLAQQQIEQSIINDKLKNTHC